MQTYFIGRQIKTDNTRLKISEDAEQHGDTTF